MTRWYFVLWLAAALGAFAHPAGAATNTQSTLETIKYRGHVRCGVSKRSPGFSHIGKSGKLTGLEVDFCAALATAVLGKSDKIVLVSLNSASRFPALKSGDVDVVVRSATWTLGRDQDLGLLFVAPLYHEGTALMVRREQGVTSSKELTGAAFCTIKGSSTQQTIETYFKMRKMRTEIVAFEKWSDAVAAYRAKRCQVLAGDAAALAGEMASMDDADQYVILQERIGQEPIGPIVRKGDEAWFEIVRWTLFAMIGAEELGLTSDNVDSRRGGENDAVRRFLGLDADVGKFLGLSRDWTYQLVKQVGNYGESFARNLGGKSALKMERSLNNLWSKGGLLHAPPFR